jgi:holo-[acyl-carrier protein] synthase
VNRCEATAPSGAHRSAAPHDSSVHVKPPDVVGRLVYDGPCTMTIIGTGLDATDIDRMGEAIARYGERFVRRVFTEGEIAYCRARRDFASSFAARFAAKEAAMKALGTGHSQGVFWTGIEVVRRHGPPRLQFHGGAAKRFASLGATGSLLTLTHSRELAIAHVMLLQD